MKTLVISGGSSGIGEATVKRFLQEGYRVFNLDIQSSSIKNPNLFFLDCDVSSVTAIQQAVKKIEGHVDVLVCNAGIHYSANILDSSEADFDRVMDLNVKGSFFLTQTILPLMVAQKRGAIVYIGSDQTLIAKKNSAIYGLTKAALSNLAKSTALDFAPYQIRANVVAPGTIETPLYHRAIKNYCDRTGANVVEVHQSEALEQPLGRLGRPEEVADLIYFLASDQAAFITGAVIPIEGGYTAK